MDKFKNNRIIGKNCLLGTGARMKLPTFVVGFGDLVENGCKNSAVPPPPPRIESFHQQENRRNLFQKIKQEMTQANRASDTLLVAMLDLDGCISRGRMQSLLGKPW